MLAYLLFQMTPYPKRFGFNIPLMFWWIEVYERREEKATNWLRRTLGEIDPGFAVQEKNQDLMQRREVARADGISPLDPRYPDIEIPELRTK